MELIKDVKRERQITIKFQEEELKLLVAVLGESTPADQEEAYMKVFDEVLPRNLEPTVREYSLYDMLYEIIMNSSDIVKGYNYEYDIPNKFEL